MPCSGSDTLNISRLPSDRGESCLSLDFGKVKASSRVEGWIFIRPHLSLIKSSQRDLVSNGATFASGIKLWVAVSTKEAQRSQSCYFF